MSTEPDRAAEAPDREAGGDFIRAIIARDRASNKHGGQVVTRFPPEPNGLLHIGHAKSICLNFGVAQETPGGRCHLRLDDTNPDTERAEYVEAIKRDIRWLGFEWGEHEYYASDYFGRLYAFAEELILAGKAYVCSLSEEEIRAYRGTISEPGRDSPYRGRLIADNLDLFRRMRAGEFPDGAHVLRAKIDMASTNMKMRDPILYRIRHASHYRAAGAWCIYPMYDFAHCLSDAIEGITHSICTLEFENNREVYDWILDNVTVSCRPQQIEFARLGLSYTVMSKRKLLTLVQEGLVSGWDDPRMPTLSGMRRRGYPPEAIRVFAEQVGVAKANSMVDVAQLEFTIRDYLNRRAPRVMCVLRPLKVVVLNYPEGEVENLEAPYYPHDVPLEGSRSVPFTRELFIEAEDFAETPPPHYYRLSPGAEVRLRYAYLVRCVGVVKDPVSGEIAEIQCTYDPETRGGDAPDGRKVKGTIHWVSASRGLQATVRLYDRLFNNERPDAEGGDFREFLNRDSLLELTGAWIEPSVVRDEPDTRYQFERQGYYWRDPVDGKDGQLVFNRIVALRDSWTAMAEKVALPAAPARKPARAESGQRQSREMERGVRPEAGESAEGVPQEVREAVDTLVREQGLSLAEAKIVAGDAVLARLFAEATGAGAAGKAIANWLVNVVAADLKSAGAGEMRYGGAELAALTRLVERGTVSITAAKVVFSHLARYGGHPERIVSELGLEMVQDSGELERTVSEVIDGHREVAEQVRAGQVRQLGFLVGQVMKATGGKADPRRVSELLQERLVKPGSKERGGPGVGA